jgi:hypothetical protein
LNSVTAGRGKVAVCKITIRWSSSVKYITIIDQDSLKSSSGREGMITRREIFFLIGSIPAAVYLGSCAAKRMLSPRIKGTPPYTFLFCNDLHISNDEQEAYFTDSVEN